MLDVPQFQVYFRNPIIPRKASLVPLKPEIPIELGHVQHFFLVILWQYFQISCCKGTEVTKDVATKILVKAKDGLRVLGLTFNGLQRHRCRCMARCMAISQSGETWGPALKGFIVQLWDMKGGYLRVLPWPLSGIRPLSGLLSSGG